MMKTKKDPNTRPNFGSPILLTADNQIGKVQYGNYLREKDNEFIWKWLCQKADQSYQGLLVAGDFFNSEAIYAKHFVRACQAAADCQVPIGIIDGNHDEGETSWFQTPGTGFHYLDNKRAEINGCQIHFLSYRNRLDLLKILKEIKENYPRTDVIVGHQMFQELSPTIDIPGVGALGQFGVKDLTEMGWKNLTIFLGDIHTSSDWHNTEDNIEIVYPGSPEMTEKAEGRHKSMRDPRQKWEDQQCYAIHWEPAPGFPQTWRRIAVPNRPWIKETIRAEKTDLEPALETLLEKVLKAPSSDPEKRHPIVHLKIVVPNETTQFSVRAQELLKKIKEHSIEFEPEIATQENKPDLLETLHENSRDFTTNDAMNRLKELVHENAKSYPQQPIIEKLVDLALLPDKTLLDQYVDRLLQGEPEPATTTIPPENKTNPSL
jgi:DNA repair exonuclease SbcCD nuclease subunit